MNTEELQSKTISVLRFPMIVLVMFIHANYGQINQDLYSLIPFKCVTSLVSERVALIAVPLFFFFSGFLFFHNGKFSRALYISKLKKRSRTLLLPYVLWNAFYLLLIFIMQCLKPGFTAAIKKQIIDFGCSDWLLSFWNISIINKIPGVAMGPVVYQFWFIQDLLVLMVLSPLIWFLIRKLKVFFVVLLLVGFFSSVMPEVVGFHSVSLTYFSLGAYCSIMKCSFVQVARRNIYFWIVLFLSVFIVNTICASAPHILMQIETMSACLLVLACTSMLIEKNKLHVNRLLADSSFFLFAYHELVLAILLYVIKHRIIVPQDSFTALSLYFAFPAVAALMGVALYYELRKYAPKFTAVITGGR